MTITFKNYHQTISQVPTKEWPKLLKEAHDIIQNHTDNGKDWSALKWDKGFKALCVTTFNKWEEFLTTRKEKKESSLNGFSKKDDSEISYAEIKHINLFLSFDKTVLLRTALERFIDELQSDIKSKKIRKSSPISATINLMQIEAIEFFNEMPHSKYFEINKQLRKKLIIALELYDNSHKDLDTSYLKLKKSKLDLEGLNGFVNAPSEVVKEATPEKKPVNVMNSVDFMKLHFEKIGFQSPWREFIGDPSRGFTMMVYGRPKFGKSFLCLDFATYLARQHGKVLYIAKEETLDDTLQIKMKKKAAEHPNLTLADGIPDDLSIYEYIFLDSVNSLNLTPSDLDALERKYKGKSFIYIFQVTKAGLFRGNNSFQHNVDVVVELPEIGKAVQYGRFNQGGEMSVFASNTSNNERFDDTGFNGTLDGNPKKTNKNDDKSKNELVRYHIGSNLEPLIKNKALIELTKLSSKEPSEWKDANKFDVSIIDVLDKLPIVNLDDFGVIDLPLTSLPKELQTKVFIYKSKDDYYFVNTEGYKYARYVLKLENYKPV
jgi:hypothetical protein